MQKRRWPHGRHGVGQITLRLFPAGAVTSQPLGTILSTALVSIPGGLTHVLGTMLSTDDILLGAGGQAPLGTVTTPTPVVVP